MISSERMSRRIVQGASGHRVLKIKKNMWEAARAAWEE